MIRAVIYFLFWMLLVVLLNRWSAAQDNGEGVTKRRLGSLSQGQRPGPAVPRHYRNLRLGRLGDVARPEWFSTIFGLLTIAGYGLTGIAFTIVVLATVDRDRPAGSLLTPRHFHDFGKLLLAFTMLWAYLSFSQFLIIWSGNLPEEIPWYIARIRGSWGAVAILLVVGHFFLPFALLLSADLKKRSRLLAKVAIFILVDAAGRPHLVSRAGVPAHGTGGPAYAQRDPDALDGRRDPRRADGAVGVPVRASAAHALAVAA